MLLIILILKLLEKFTGINSTVIIKSIIGLNIVGFSVYCLLTYFDPINIYFLLFYGDGWVVWIIGYLEILVFTFARNSAWIIYSLVFVIDNALLGCLLLYK